MKLVVEEPETGALREALAGTRHQIASAVVEVEVPRAVRRIVPELAGEAARVLGQLNLVEAGGAIRARAARLHPPELRSLDAIHLATALEAAEEIDAFVTYDVRLAAAAAAAGLDVLSPAAEAGRGTAGDHVP